MRTSKEDFEDMEGPEPDSGDLRALVGEDCILALESRLLAGMPQNAGR
jgi:hypothetical protein